MTEKKKPKGDYPVGYCQPPKENQFQPGQSGNRKGRPKGVKNLKTDFAEEARERIRVTVGGKPKTLTQQRAWVKALHNEAMKGNTRAMSILLNMTLRMFGLGDDELSEAELTAMDKELLAFALEQLSKQKNTAK